MGDPISQLKLAQFAICSIPGGRFIAKYTIKRYIGKIPINDIRSLLCNQNRNEVMISFENILKLFKNKYWLDPMVRKGVSVLLTNKDTIINKLFEVRNNPKIKQKLDMVCVKLIQSKKVDMNELINKLLDIFCAMPLGLNAMRKLSPTQIQNLTKTVGKSVLNIKSQMNVLKTQPTTEVSSEQVIEKVPLTSIEQVENMTNITNNNQLALNSQATSQVTGGKSRTSKRKIKKYRKTRKFRQRIF